MILALTGSLLACGDPVVEAIDAVAVPRSAEAPTALDSPVARIGVTADGIWLDPRPWAPNQRPVQVMALDDPQGHELALPALVTALEPVRDAREEPFVPEVRVDAALPYRAAVRVLYSLGMAASDGSWIGVQGGALRLHAPTYCGEAAADDGPRCVLVTVAEDEAGLLLRTDLVSAAHDGCQLIMGGDAGGRVTDLAAALEQTRALGEPCRSAVVQAAESTPWQQVIDRWVLVRKTHPDAVLGIAPPRP